MAADRMLGALAARVGGEVSSRSRGDGEGNHLFRDEIACQGDTCGIQT